MSSRQKFTGEQRHLSVVEHLFALLRTTEECLLNSLGFFVAVHPIFAKKRCIICRNIMEKKTLKIKCIDGILLDYSLGECTVKSGIIDSASS